MNRLQTSFQEWRHDNLKNDNDYWLQLLDFSISAIRMCIFEQIKLTAILLK